MKHESITAMDRMSRRKFGLGLLFAGAAGVAAARQPNRHIDYLGRDKLDKLLPETMGNWKFVTSSGLVVPPEDQLARAIYSQLLTRIYVDQHDSPVMLLAAQSASQTGILQIHRPEFCYTASGFDLSSEGIHPIPLGSRTLLANRLTARGEGRIEHILYWTRLGDHLPTSWIDQKLAVAGDNLRRIIPDAMLMRVSAIGSDAPAALRSMEQFIAAMVASVPAAKRKIFIG